MGKGVDDLGSNAEESESFPWGIVPARLCGTFAVTLNLKETLARESRCGGSRVPRQGTAGAKRRL